MCRQEIFFLERKQKIFFFFSNNMSDEIKNHWKIIFKNIINITYSKQCHFYYHKEGNEEKCYANLKDS